MRLLVSGGLQRENADQLGNGQRYKEARLFVVDWERGTRDLVYRHEPTAGLYPESLPSTLFGALTVAGDRLYVAAPTEILIFSFPELKPVGHVTHPLCNEVHHARPFGEALAACSTGLDMVLLLDPETGALKHRYDALQRPEPWDHFDPATDYRKVTSTKPHAVHPNHLFVLDGELWVTRFHQRDAVCLTDPTQRLDIGVERPHDGLLQGNRLFFTTVNGHVVEADAEARKVVRDIDLNRFERTDDPLGWCRGLHVAGDDLYVGFSQLRSTRIKANIQWAVRRLKDLSTARYSTRIAHYDARAGVKHGEVVFKAHELSAIFGILPLPEREGA